MERRPPSRRRDPVRTRAAILQSARSVFIEHGFTGARTAEIARGAAVPQGLLYHYFDNKQALFNEVMEQALAPYFETQARMLESQPEVPDLDLLERSVRLYFRFLQENPHVPRLLAWWDADQGWREGPLIQEQALCERVQRLGEQRIREGQEGGVLRADLEPAFVIQFFVGLCQQWFVTQSATLLGRGLDPDDPEQRERMDELFLENLVTVFLNGVRAHPPKDSR